MGRGGGKSMELTKTFVDVITWPFSMKCKSIHDIRRYDHMIISILPTLALIAVLPHKTIPANYTFPSIVLPTLIVSVGFTACCCIPLLFRFSAASDRR